ncbi:hypothetical protein D3C83_04680 [compost metagenome]
MQALDHGPFLGRHQSGRLRARDAERVARLVRIQAERAAGCRGRREYPAHGGGVETALEYVPIRGDADSQPRFITGHRCGDEFPPRKIARPLRQGQRNRKTHGPHVHGRARMRVIQLERVAGGAVDQDRLRDRGAVLRAKQASVRLPALLQDRVGHHARPRQGRAEQAAPEGVEEAGLGLLHHLRRQRVEPQFADERCQLLRRSRGKSPGRLRR